VSRAVLAEWESGATGFDRVYAEERTAIVRLAYLLVRSQAEAEELAQEAFLRLYLNFNRVENPPAFLRTVVARLASTSRRRRDVERRKLVSVTADVGTEPADVDETWTAIGRLKPERAVVIVLRFYEDLPHAEIARMLGCPAATVRSRMRRALKDLRKELDR
jgi:RNA polymerase sigma factor (sigma-70 family)